MCALILLHRLVRDFPVLLAANRDEWYDRPAGPPGLIPGSDRTPAHVAPRDLRAGGTWIGTNASGLTVCITNRREELNEVNDPDRPSRGTLVQEALGQHTATAARHHLRAFLADRPFAPFNLLFADREDAYLTRHASPGESARTVRLDPGPHIITNLHDLGEIEILEVDLIASTAAESALVEVVGALAEVLKSREAVTETGFSLCKDDGRRGTVSSTLIARGAAGTGMYLHADGPPDRSPYVDYSQLLREMG